MSMLITSTLPHISLVSHETRNENAKLTLGFNDNLASNL